MQIDSVSTLNTNFRGKFVRNQAWKNIEQHYNKYGISVIKDFEPYIKLVEKCCPESSLYAFEEKEMYNADRGFYNLYTLYRNNSIIGKGSVPLRAIQQIFESVKEIIVKDAVGDIK